MKKIIKEAAGQQEEKIATKAARKDGGANSAAACESSSTRMKELRDGPLSSNEDMEPEPDDLSEESSENDDDLFQGPFAIKDKEEAHRSAHATRVDGLPPKIAAHISNFEPAVLPVDSGRCQ